LKFADNIDTGKTLFTAKGYTMIRHLGAQRNGTIHDGMKKNGLHNTRDIGTDAAGKRDRIGELKKQIENGDYVIDLRATAIRMAQELRP